MKLDRQSFVPLYYQIQERLRQEIETGHIGPGEPVPSERELSVEYGVSRMTARQALRVLREDGLVVSDRGKGTFVARAKVARNVQQLASFTEDMLRRGLTPSSRVLKIARLKASQNPVAQEKLQLGPREPMISIRRLRLADGEPMALETCYLPLKVCPDIETFDLASQSLYAVLEKHYAEIGHAEELIEASRPGKRVAALLGISQRVPLLSITRTVYSRTGDAIEYVRSLYRGDRYSSVVYVQRAARSRPTNRQ